MAVPAPLWNQTPPFVPQGFPAAGPAAPKNQQWEVAASILWILGLVFSYFGAHELLTSFRCGDSPRRIACAQLARSGPPETAFVTLTNFTPKLDGCIHWHDQRDHWTMADVPLLADGDATPHVIVQVKQAHSAENLRNALSQSELTGVITGRGLCQNPSAMLASNNPGMDPASCWVVEFGARPLDKRLMSLVSLGGMTFLAAGIWMLFEKLSSPLMFVSGLLALGRRFPISRRSRGAILLPVALAVSLYGGYHFVKLASPQAAAQMGDEFFAIGALQMGTSLVVVAGSMLLFAGDPAA